LSKGDSLGDENWCVGGEGKGRVMEAEYDNCTLYIRKYYSKTHLELLKRWRRSERD
jgi:hypothetical protein